jgi:hypothetical protein
LRSIAGAEFEHGAVTWVLAEPFAHSFDVTAALTAGVVLVTAALVTIVLRGEASECGSAADAPGVAVACAG